MARASVLSGNDFEPGIRFHEVHAGMTNFVLGDINQLLDAQQMTSVTSAHPGTRLSASESPTQSLPITHSDTVKFWIRPLRAIRALIEITRVAASETGCPL
jgi:hypothetical protein